MNIILPFILLVALLLAALAYLAFKVPVKLFFLLDSDEMDIHLSATWLPLLRIEAELAPSGTHISVYSFNMRIISRFVTGKGRKDYTILKALSLRDTCIRIFYGLNAPYLTGILFGALSFIGLLTEIDTLEQFPEFVPENEYLRIEGNFDLNAGKTVARLIQLKSTD